MSDEEDKWYLSGPLGVGATSPRNPLAVRATKISEELMSFEDANGVTKWHINQKLHGTLPGLNFVETTIADGRLFLQPGGNVGIGTTEPKTTLHINGVLRTDGNRTVINGFDGASNHWFKTNKNGDENDAVFMAFVGTQDGDAQRVYIRPGGANGKSALVAEKNGQITLEGNVQVKGQITGKGCFLVGMITMWYGDIGNIPAGWALCNGQSGTPDLSGRFIVGYAAGDPGYNQKGNTGGEKHHTLSLGELPTHGHTGHTNDEALSFSMPEGTIGIGDWCFVNAHAGNPFHIDLTHGHSFTTENAGGNQAFDNRPPYYVLAYIMYTGV